MRATHSSGGRPAGMKAQAMEGASSPSTSLEREGTAMVADGICPGGSGGGSLQSSDLNLKRTLATENPRSAAVVLGGPAAKSYEEEVAKDVETSEAQWCRGWQPGAGTAKGRRKPALRFATGRFVRLETLKGSGTP